MIDWIPLWNAVFTSSALLVKVVLLDDRRRPSQSLIANQFLEVVAVNKCFKNLNFIACGHVRRSVHHFLVLKAPGESNIM